MKRSGDDELVYLLLTVPWMFCNIHIQYTNYKKTITVAFIIIPSKVLLAKCIRRLELECSLLEPVESQGGTVVGELD